MKYPCTICLALALAAFCLPACQNKPETADQTITDSMAQPTNPARTDLPEAPLTDQLRTLGLTQTGDWRGIALGDSLGVVRVSEKVAKSELFEKDATHIGYGIELKQLESMDVQYFCKNALVTSIQADLYLNDKPSVTIYTADLTAYFTARYGKPTVANGQTTWVGPRGENISLKNVSKGKDFGLKVLCSIGNPAGGPQGQ